MAIKFRPNVGDILECDFGLWADGVDFDGHIPPEMRKRRMVAVINARLDAKSTLVVPISSSEGNKLNPINEFLPDTLFQVTHFYDKRDRYALCGRLLSVSNERLFPIYDKGVIIRQKLPNDVISAIQRKIIKAINAQSILRELEAAQAENLALKGEIDSLKKEL